MNLNLLYKPLSSEKIFPFFSTESKFGKAVHQVISAVLKRKCCHQSNLKTMEQAFQTIRIRIGTRHICAGLDCQSEERRTGTPAGDGFRACGLCTAFYYVIQVSRFLDTLI